MQFILGCLFYAFIGAIIGVAAHLFNGVVQEHITFNWHYVKTLAYNFFKLTLVLSAAVLATGCILLLIPEQSLPMLGTNREFLHSLVYYLYAFAAFDFTLEHVVEKKRGMELK